MTYLLIALVVMVALSPLISMMPSRRQRQIADLRQRAANCGIRVQLRELPNAAKSGDLRPFYGRHRQRGDHKIAVNAVYQRHGEGWQSSAGAPSANLMALLAQLPPGVSHVCENLHEVGIFWDERGPEADVERIDAALQQLLQ
ncbi:MAG: hypothetical protein O7F73_08700 [Gammaproteobacteria bacterium]|nr:hypothetical protein [Gammaproteobacteria bacterium]